MDEKLEILLKYLDRGWSLFPCLPKQKAPATVNGFLDATLDRNQVEAWHKNNPSYNWATPCGLTTGILCIDVEKEGLKGWERLVDDHGLPETVVTETGGLGNHYLFKFPKNGKYKRKIKWRAGVDVLGSGGYILLPPSETENPYRFLHGLIDLADIPPWLLERISPPKKTKKVKEVKIKEGVIPQGERNNQLTSIAGSYRQQGLDREEILERIQMHNENSCDPPLDDREVERIAESVSSYEPGEEQDEPIAVRLVRYAHEAGIRLFHSETMDPFAMIIVDDHFECHRLRSRSFATWLSHLLYRIDGHITNRATLDNARQTLEGEALFDSPMRELYVRVAEHEGKIYLDLGDDQWRVIEISVDGWRFIDEAPVMFIRGSGMESLPDPIGGGNLPELIKPFIRVKDENQMKLVIAWLVMTLYPAGPFPILIAGGAQGSGKSMSQKFLRRIIDPNKGLLRAPPRKEKDLVISAQNSWVLGLDNVSRLSDWLSDSLCRLVTGDAISSRQLWTDSDEYLLVCKRPLLLNGIGDFASRPDLLDRALLTTLPMIETDERRSERDLEAAFVEAHPHILGALLDAASMALYEFDAVDLDDHTERMADFSQWAEAASSSFDWYPGDFMKAYKHNRMNMHYLAIESSPVAKAIMTWFEGEANDYQRWVGAAEDLLRELGQFAPAAVTKQKVWPKTGAHLSNAIKRAEENLLKVGIRILTGQNIKIEETGHYLRRAIIVEAVINE